MLAAVKSLIPPKKEINLVRDVTRKLRVLLPTFKLENGFVWTSMDSVKIG